MSRLDDPEIDAVVTEVVHWLSKTGNLSTYSVELSKLASVLSREDVLKFYGLLGRKRAEFEWRDAFIERFPDSANYLPPISITREDFESALAAGKVRFLSAADRQKRHDA